MKYKSYSLIEILVASMIFMIVIVVSITAFGMVRRTNTKADDLRLTNQCARQIEDYIGSQIRSANTKERIMAIADRGAGSYIFRKLPDSFDNYYQGLVLFNGANSYLAIYKIGGVYYAKSAQYTNEHQVEDGKTIPGIIPDRNAVILPDACAAFETVEPDFIKNPRDPFMGRKIGRGDNTIEIILKDAVYRSGLESQEISIENKSFSTVSLRVSNNLTNL